MSLRSLSNSLLERLASFGCQGSFWRVLLERVGMAGPVEGPERMGMARPVEGSEPVDGRAEGPVEEPVEGLAEERTSDEFLGGGMGGVDMV
jgi:hypothetical protein